MADAQLVKKLSLEKYPRKLMQNAPEGWSLLSGTGFDTVPEGVYGLSLRFVFALPEMRDAIAAAPADGLLAPGGYLYLAYPKKGNKLYPHIDRDSLFPFLSVNDDDGYVADLPMKFSKMVALDEVFTLVGIKYLPDRPKDTRESQSVDLYADRVCDIRALLDHHLETLAVYDALTPGYQKDWARHIFSAKGDATREKRVQEMIDLLGAGYKSVALFRLGKKS